MTDLTHPVIEAELADHAVAPRVTVVDIENEIIDECYFSPKAVADEEGLTSPHPSLGCLTICVLVLKNGFTVTGESAYVSPDNYDQTIGERIARQNAVEKIWPLLGFRLKDRLALAAAGTPKSHTAQRTYVGQKAVHARPMTRGVYNELRGWDLPADEHPSDPGYLVEYADGGEPNVEGYYGYVSWSPSDVFERAYGEPVA